MGLAAGAGYTGISLMWESPERHRAQMLAAVVRVLEGYPEGEVTP